ncbi:hypothetical protein B484DRAFT_160247 [Ochromonadaceae sp. CCMP2298]|nr:hypothetical protein B484DRAFT_160247 [Ochromonadaceae sp. CCMP2298]
MCWASIQRCRKAIISCSCGRPSCPQLRSWSSEYSTTSSATHIIYRETHSRSISTWPRCISEISTSCGERRSLILFSYIGACILVITLLLLCLSRYLELKILSQRGLTSHLQYSEYVTTPESGDGREIGMSTASLKEESVAVSAGRCIKPTPCILLCVLNPPHVYYNVYKPTPYIL